MYYKQRFCHYKILDSIISGKLDYAYGKEHIGWCWAKFRPIVNYETYINWLSSIGIPTESVFCGINKTPVLASTKLCESRKESVYK